MTSQALGEPPSRSWASTLPLPWPGSLGVGQGQQWAAPDLRRLLQLALAGFWLLDAVLQFQAAMFTTGFARMLAATAPGNPAVIAGPITWAARIISEHVTAANATFAFIQLLLGLAIAWRPTVRVGLAATVAWAVAVWWLGEGLGGVLTGGGSPVNGAPGSVIIYGLLAVLLWPRREARTAPFVAGRSIGPNAARALWLALWGSLSYLALTPATAAPAALSSMVSGMAVGQPGWLAALDNHLAAFLASRGPGTATGLAVILAIVAVGAYLPRPAARAVIVLAIVTAAALWIAQGLGGVLTGGGTDPNSGPLLALMALSFWPLSARRTRSAADASKPEPDCGRPA
jgi:hypothetical protein